MKYLESDKAGANTKTIYEDEEKLIENKVEELVKLRENALKETEEWAKKRDVLNQKSSNLNATIREEKEKKEEALTELASLKEIRAKKRDEKQKLINKFRKLREKTAKEKGIRSVPLHILRKKLRDIEWRIETTAKLSLEEEKELVKQANNIQKQIDEAELELGTITHGKDIEMEIKALNMGLKDLNSRLKKKFQEIQKYREKTNSLFEELKKTRAKADESHEKFIEFKKIARGKQREINDLLMRRKVKMRRSQKEKLEALQVKLDEKVKKALEKLEGNGRARLTFEEFNLLLERGLI